MRGLVALVVLSLLLPAVSAQQGDLSVSWINPQENLEVGKVYTARFLVTDERGDPVGDALVHLELPDGSRIEFQELVTNDDGIAFASLVYDEPAKVQYGAWVTGRIDGADIVDVNGLPSFFDVNITKVAIEAQGVPMFVPVGDEAQLFMQARWLHDGSPIRNPDPDAPDSMRFVLEEQGDDTLALKKTDRTGGASIPFQRNETGLYLVTVGATNTPMDGVEPARAFIAWVDEATLRPEVIQGKVAGAGAGVVIRIRIDSALNDHWVPLEYRVETDSQGNYVQEVQFTEGDEVLVYVVGDTQRRIAGDVRVLTIDLNPPQPPQPGQDPDLDSNPPPSEQKSPSVALLVLIAAIALLGWRKR